MGFVLDKNSVEIYEKWLQGPVGMVMDGFVRTMFHDLLAVQRHDRILDIGCGTGNQLLALAKFGFDLTGVDASEDMLDIAMSRLGNRCAFKAGRAEDLPFSDNEFDISLLINTLEFLDDPLAALIEAGRVTRRKVLICVINSLSLCNLGARLRGLFSETLLRNIRSYNLWEMKGHIKNAFGAVPVVWRCAPDWPKLKGQVSAFNSDRERVLNCPFGSILGISVTLNPVIRAGSLPLKIKAEQPFPESIPIQYERFLKDIRDVSHEEMEGAA